MRILVARLDQSSINVNILTRHPRGIESILECLAACVTVKISNPAHRFYCLGDTLHNEPCATVVDHFRHRSIGPRNHWSAARQRLDHHEAKWLWPIYREQQCTSVTQKLILLTSTDLANELHPVSCVMKQRCDVLSEVFVLSINLCRDFEFHPGLPGDANGTIKSFDK